MPIIKTAGRKRQVEESNLKSEIIIEVSNYRKASMKGSEIRVEKRKITGKWRNNKQKDKKLFDQQMA